MMHSANNTSLAPAPDWWKTDVLQVQEFMHSLQHPERMSRLATSSGDREIWLYSTLDNAGEGKGTANFNSACAVDTDAYFLRGPGKRDRPRIVVIGGVHGTETEGIAGALSLIRALDKGLELDGKETLWSELLGRVDWVICPLANPDGRKRHPLQGFVGVDRAEMQALNCGTRANGEPYGWPGCKVVHPMRGDVGILGGYFDDNGANIMHDEWFAPHSPATTALLKLVATTGPDLVLNLHSSDLPICFFLRTWYVPWTVKQALLGLTQAVYATFETGGYPVGELPWPQVEDEQGGNSIPAFNLDSMLFHAGATLTATFESPRGLAGQSPQLNYQQLLCIHQQLFKTTAEFVGNWYANPDEYPFFQPSSNVVPVV